MIAQAGYVESLHQLPWQEFRHEMRRTLIGSLHRLATAVKRAAAARGLSLDGCIIDDYQVTRARTVDAQRVILLFYRASAWPDDGPGTDDTYRLSGSAELTVGEDREVTFNGVVVQADQTPAAPGRGG